MYYAGRSGVFYDNYGEILRLTHQNFVYTDSQTFTVSNDIKSVVYIEINGLVDEIEIGYEISGTNTVTLIDPPIVGSRVSVCYLY